MIQVSEPHERHIIDQGKFIMRIVDPGLKLKNPADHGIGPLGRFDHATLEPGTVVKMHLHKNDEIISYIRKGFMLHEDTHGNKIPIHGQHLMIMNSGAGVMHEEGVPPESEETVELLQIFIRPKADNLVPKVQFYNFDSMHSMNSWRLVAGPELTEAPLKIRSQVWLYDVKLEKATLATPDLNGLTGLLYVFEGEVEVPGEAPRLLPKGSSVVVKEEQLQLKADDPAELVFFLLDEHSGYTRSGKYSG